ncbi:MAG: SGNH/GDSL hydrolase family protein [Bryobacterales bacterium]|nr:SGNH/GDSL hydrolase family protein [Bryobacterales bacterium]
MRISALLLPLTAICLFAQQPAPDVERMQRTLRDWANLGRYAADNAKVQAPKPGEDRVVFMGDSITDAWGRKYQHFFAGKPYINRGISGQTTPQMLIRFRPDVLAHQPKAVVILAGTNDIAGNTGPMTLEQIQGNIQTMAELAMANGIKVVLASVLPICDYHRNQSERRPMEKIKALNAWMKGYAAGSGAIYLDYYSAMLDDAGLLKKELTYDGLHPNEEGYAVMEPLAAAAIQQALR